MNFSEYLNLVLENSDRRLSAVKRLILQTLWDASSNFPREWVTSDYLLELTRQKYFDRRVRELRDNFGCDIENSTLNNKSVWRLRSPNINSKNQRSYLTDKQKEGLFKRNNYACQICGKSTMPGLRGLQADHKVPLSRGGSNEVNNWQSICHECNIAKRRVCQSCELDCEQCSWAYPERIGFLVSIPVPQELVEPIRRISIEFKELFWQELSKIIKKILE